MRAWLRVGVVGLLAVTAGGCHAGAARRPCARSSQPDLLFNPGVETTLAQTDRSVWPETFAHNQPAEDITYRETVMNHQGRWGFDDDRPYRRFESVREGRIRR